MGDAKKHTTEGPGEPDRNPPEDVAGGEKVHTPDGSHPAGDGQRSEGETGGADYASADPSDPGPAPDDASDDA